MSEESRSEESPSEESLSHPSIGRRTLLGGLLATTGTALVGGVASPARAVPAVAAAPVGSEAAATAVGYHPGHYFWNARRYWSDTQQASDFTALDQVASNPYIKGIKIAFNWYYFEGAQNDFGPGFRIIDAYLNKLQSLPTTKHLMLSVAERTFGNYTGTAYPDYVWDNGWVVTPAAGDSWSGGLSSIAKLWQPEVMDRLIAMSEAFAAEYDGHPRFEMYSHSETALSLPESTGFTVNGWFNELVRWFTVSKQLWPSTALRLYANYLRNDGWIGNLMNTVVNAHQPGSVAIGGPDPELPLPNPTRTIAANRVFRGETTASADLRGAVPWVGEVQQLGLDDPYRETPSEIFDYYYDVMHANYMVWLRNFDSSVGGTEQQWNTGILPYINSIQGRIHTEYPTIGSWITD